MHCWMRVRIPMNAPSGMLVLFSNVPMATAMRRGLGVSIFACPFSVFAFDAVPLSLAQASKGAKESANNPISNSSKTIFAFIIPSFLFIERQSRTAFKNECSAACTMTFSSCPVRFSLHKNRAYSHSVLSPTCFTTGYKSILSPQGMSSTYQSPPVLCKREFFTDGRLRTVLRGRRSGCTCCRGSWRTRSRSRPRSRPSGSASCRPWGACAPRRQRSISPRGAT